MLPTQVFPCLPARATFVADTNFVSATIVSQFAQPKQHHGQQCVRNNVSSFTRALNPKNVIQRTLKLPSISHTCFFDTKLDKPLPVLVFICAYEVAQSPHENSMSGGNTRSVLARFGDNNWEKREDFVKPFYVKKLVWEMEGSLSARAG